MRIMRPTSVDLLELAANMTADERVQFCALHGTEEYDADMAAQSFIAMPGHKFVLVDDAGTPLVGGGYVEIGPGEWQSWMVGTEAAWRDSPLAITRAVRKVMRAMFDGGARRLQTHARIDREKAHAWYEKGLGMTCEGVRRMHYLDGTDAIVFSRVARDVL